jgi:polyribonucleotide 5'-hydroxyl-kinase
LNLDINLIIDQAEIFGTEISVLKTYRFPGGTKLAVFTYHGCTIEMGGDVMNPYVASETPMNAYFEITEQLEKERY